MKTTIVFIYTFSIFTFFFAVGTEAWYEHPAVARFPPPPKKNGPKIKEPVFLNINRTIDKYEKGHLTYNHTDKYPEDGKPFFKFWDANTTVTTAEVEREGVSKHNGSVLFTVTNNATIPMQLKCLFTNMKTKENVQPGVNFPYLELQPNSTIQIGNTVPRGLGEHYNGMLEAKWGCNQNGTRCNGFHLEQDVGTFVEWTYDGKGQFWSDISYGKKIVCASKSTNVDRGPVNGINTNINMTIMNSTSACNPERWCNVTKARLEKVCPKQNIWHHSETIGCQADCQHWGPTRFCNGFSASKAILKHLCPNAYDWADDNRERIFTDGCKEDVRGMKIVFGQIK